MASTLVLNESYYNENNCSFDDLQVAVNKLSVISEEEFNSIKNEKWFTRVFDMVTFSNKKDIRLATQIQNVVQAQEILIQILVRLSARDQQLNNLVEEAFAKIEKLSEQDVVLAETVKKLEAQFYFGISNEATLETLTENEKYVLGAILLALADCYETTSDAQKEYADLILTYLNVQEAEIDYKQALSNITNLDKKKLLLQISLEYVFLHKGNFEVSDAINEIIMEFDFGQKTIDSVIEKIYGVYNLRGVDGFFNRLNIELLNDGFEVEFQGGETEKVDLNKLDLENLTFNKILNIKPSEHRVFENKIIDVKTFINVEGEVTFKNCIIKYATEKTTNCITLSKESQINFINCEIISEENNDSFFIEGMGGNMCLFESCNLIKCGKLLEVTNKYDILIENCLLIDPKLLMIQSVDTVEGSLKMLNSKLVIKSLYEVKTIFNVAAQVVIESCYIEGNKLAYNELMSSDGNVGFLSFDENQSLINSPNIKVQESEFLYLNRIFYGPSYMGKIHIDKSSFKSCIAICNSFIRGEMIINECTFDQGTKFFVNGEYTIRNSIFKNTIGNIFEGYFKLIEESIKYFV